MAYSTCTSCCKCKPKLPNNVLGCNVTQPVWIYSMSCLNKGDRYVKNKSFQFWYNGSMKYLKTSGSNSSAISVWWVWVAGYVLQHALQLDSTWNTNTKVQMNISELRNPLLYAVQDKTELLPYKIYANVNQNFEGDWWKTKKHAITLSWLQDRSYLWNGS